MVKVNLVAAVTLAAAALLAPTAGFPQDAAAPTEISPATPLPDVPRNQTLILGWSITSPIGVTNPWAIPGYTHQEGNVFMWEPLMYFGIFADEYIPWLADSMEYTSADFTALKIKLNPDAKWSDGTPVTSKDVVYTFEGQMNNDKLPYHAAFEQFVDTRHRRRRPDRRRELQDPGAALQVRSADRKVRHRHPDRARHAWESAQADVNACCRRHSRSRTPAPMTSSPGTPTRRSSTCAKTGGRSRPAASPLPEVKRIVMVNIGGQVGQNMDTVAQRVVNNEFDSALDMRSSVIGNILAQNPKITTHTGNESPYGYLDWWPNSLWMNTQLEPYNDPNVRRAISLSINRDLINEILYEGAQIATIYPFPLYPSLQAFADCPAVKALEEKYQPRKFDPEESAELMTEAGFTKNGDGLWEKDGATVDATIQGFEGIHSDIVPILVEMLRNGGFDAAINFGTDAYQNMADGKAGLYMFGHGASLLDPYAALELFHGRTAQRSAPSAGNNRFSRYKNPEFDAILDEMAPLGVGRSEVPRRSRSRRWGSTGATRSTSRSSSGCTASPTTRHYWTNWPTDGQPRHGHQRRLLGADRLARGHRAAVTALSKRLQELRGARQRAHTPSAIRSLGRWRHVGCALSSLIASSVLAFSALVIWAASTIIFFIPRLSPRNAIRERFAELARMRRFLARRTWRRSSPPCSSSSASISRCWSNTGLHVATLCGSISATRCSTIRRPSST